MTHATGEKEKGPIEVSREDELRARPNQVRGFSIKVSTERQVSNVRSNAAAHLKIEDEDRNEEEAAGSAFWLLLDRAVTVVGRNQQSAVNSWR